MGYTSKYPEIIVDAENNSQNPQQTVLLTVEQLYDIMHHTHNLKDIEGSAEHAEVEVGDLEEKISALKDEVVALKEQIDSLKDESLEIGDWDAIKPGIQDPDGNTIEDPGEEIDDGDGGSGSGSSNLPTTPVEDLDGEIIDDF